MPGSRFVTVPVHPGCGFREYLHPVHTHITCSGNRILCMDKREGYEPASVVGPAFQNRELFEVRLEKHALLAWRVSLEPGREPSGGLLEVR
ncbi:hypothetical protein SDC9_85098 [bioreactor metagenome]|uniref:Uncharacterized protein n=1 Tax=bioreactor metagenome TaxID=1076179 RepID=A0A644ZCJ8_9ZZZZ